MRDVVRVSTMEEMLNCNKYQKVALPNFSEGDFEVYVGQFMGRPISLGKDSDESIIFRTIKSMGFDKNGDFVAIYEMSKIGTDSPNYDILSCDYNEGVAA